MNVTELMAYARQAIPGASGVSDNGFHGGDTEVMVSTVLGQSAVYDAADVDRLAAEIAELEAEVA